MIFKKDITFNILAYNLLGDTMTNVDNFKAFVKRNPGLLVHVRNGTTTWQKLYEIYDLYGEENSVWKDYLASEDRSEKKETKNMPSTGTLSNIMDMIKHLDTNKIQDGITSMQKAISLFGDMLVKDKTDSGNNYSPRPIYRKFDD